ncbi:hypothetical protein B0J13DRAFT_613443 [Dactylonectria estremocensis]|uniref:Uncharacterized protein n=1 Tax=Dactylonectria estremocensis TaxID=1079267 RepID=A0A9P9D8N1_9HYPO|nr:hypothetical protein B0J13DRAFT_613443 [Dactylonectria estremocensis]
MMNVDTKQAQYSGQEGHDMTRICSPLPSPPPPPRTPPSHLSSPLSSSPPPLSPPPLSPPLPPLVWPLPPSAYLTIPPFNERVEQVAEDRARSAAKDPGRHADASSASRNECAQFTDPSGREVNETSLHGIFPSEGYGTMGPRVLGSDGRAIGDLHGQSMLRVSPTREPGEGSGSSSGDLNGAIYQVDAGNVDQNQSASRGERRRNLSTPRANRNGQLLSPQPPQLTRQSRWERHFKRDTSVRSSHTSR